VQIKLVFFGRPREQLRISNETAEIPDGLSTLAELLAWLRSRGETWAYELSDNRVRCAINQEFSALTARIHDRDEIAIFSPISGG
jgi:sulfur-carrier protein